MAIAGINLPQRKVSLYVLTFIVTFSVNKLYAEPPPVGAEAQKGAVENSDCETIFLNLIPIHGVNLRNLGKATLETKNGGTDDANVWKDKNVWALIGTQEPGQQMLSSNIFARSPRKDDSRILHISLHGRPGAVGIVGAAGGTDVNMATIIKALTDKGMQLNDRELIVLYSCFGAVCNAGQASAARQLANLTGIKVVAPNGTLAPASFSLDRHRSRGMFKISKRPEERLSFWSITIPEKFRSDAALNSQVPNEIANFLNLNSQVAEDYWKSHYQNSQTRDPR